MKSSFGDRRKSRIADRRERRHAGVAHALAARPVAGGAEGAVERLAVGRELPRVEPLRANPVGRPVRLRHVAAAQRQHVERQQVDLRLGEAERRASASPARRAPAPGSAPSASRQRPWPGTCVKSSRPGSFWPSASQVRAVVAADAVDLVAAAAAARVEERLGLDEPGCADARVRAARRARRDPVLVTSRKVVRQGPARRRRAPGLVVVVPVGAESGRADERQIGSLHAAAAGSQRAAAPVEAMAGQAVVALERREPGAQVRDVRNRDVGVTGAAAGLGVARRDHRLGPERHVAVGVGRLGGPALAAVARRAAELGRIVRHGRVRDRARGRSARRSLARSHADVAGDAAIGDRERRHDDLPQLDLDRRRPARSSAAWSSRQSLKKFS